jgi:hypothetical protein
MLIFELLTGQLHQGGLRNGNGLTTNARVPSPWSIWGDENGRLFFYDPKSHTIRGLDITNPSSISQYAVGGV